VSTIQRRLLGTILLCTSTALVPGCGGEGRVELGNALDESAAVALAELLREGRVTPPAPVVVSGRVGEVCQSSGCWFVLQDGTGDSFREVFTDLKSAASFAVPRHIGGRDAVVAGRLVTRDGNLQLRATGLVLK